MHHYEFIKHFVRTSRFLPGTEVLHYSRVELISSPSEMEHSKSGEMQFDWFSKEIHGRLIPVTFVRYGLNTAHYTGKKLSPQEIQELWNVSHDILRDLARDDYQQQGELSRTNTIQGKAQGTLLQLNYCPHIPSVELRALGPQVDNPTSFIGALNLNSLGKKPYGTLDEKAIEGGDYCWREGFALLPFKEQTLDELLRSERVIL